MTVFLKNLDLSKIKTARANTTKNSHLTSKSHNKRQIQIPSFPAKLYQMLQEVDEQGLDHIVSWQHDGRSFRVHKSEKFVTEILPSYFRCSKMKSFQRQLNFYKFQRIVGGSLDGSYSHPHFIRGEEDLAKNIRRQELPQLISTSDAVINTRYNEAIPIDSREEECSDANLEATEDDIIQIDRSLDDLHDSLQTFLDTNFSNFDVDGTESFREGSRVSFVGKKFFFLPVEFTDLYRV